jgi:hypothetical protein
MNKNCALVQWSNIKGRQKFSVVSIDDIINTKGQLKSDNEYNINYNGRKIKGKLKFIE